MKVLHISTSDTGGAFQAAYRLHLGLLKLGVHSKMLVLYYNNNLLEVSEFLKERTVWYRFCDSLKSRFLLHRKKRSLRNMVLQFALASSPYNIKRHSLFVEADIINLHWVSGFLDYSSFFKELKKPVVWTLHDMAPFSSGFHYNCYRESGLEALEKKNLEIKVDSIKRHDRLHIVSPSKWLLNESELSKTFKNSEHHHIPYSLDTDVFKFREQSIARKEFDIPENKKVLLFLSDDINDHRKGFKILDEALTVIDQKDILLLVVGGGTTLKCQLPNKQLGFLSNQETLATAYSAADLFVIPSIEDNLPNTMLEALCCGIPVVGFCVGGIGETIKEGFNGHTTPKLDAIALASIIQKALDYNFDNKAIAKDAKQKFKISNQAAQYIKYYNRLMG